LRVKYLVRERLITECLCC